MSIQNFFMFWRNGGDFMQCVNAPLSVRIRNRVRDDPLCLVKKKKMHILHSNKIARNHTELSICKINTFLMRSGCILPYVKD